MALGGEAFEAGQRAGVVLTGDGGLALALVAGAGLTGRGGDGEPGQGQHGGPRDEGRQSQQQQAAVAAPRGEPSNGISGDARLSTEALGKQVFEMKIEYAVRQIQALLAPSKPQG